MPILVSFFFSSSGNDHSFPFEFEIAGRNRNQTRNFQALSFINNQTVTHDLFLTSRWYNKNISRDKAEKLLLDTVSLLHLSTDYKVSKHAVMLM